MAGEITKARKASKAAALAEVATAAVAARYAAHPQQAWVDGARSRVAEAEAEASCEPRVVALEAAVLEQLTARLIATAGAAAAKAPRQVAEDRLLRKKWAKFLFQMRYLCGGTRDVAALQADLKVRFEASMGLQVGAIETSAALQQKWRRAWKSFLELCAEHNRGEPS